MKTTAPNILDKIVATKKKEVENAKQKISIYQLENSAYFNERTYSLSKMINNSLTGIIAEHKRKSPSKDVINNSLQIENVVSSYQNAGASGISVLTDNVYFGGSLEDLLITKSNVQIPILRKEFIIDEYQIVEAKAHGADVILLIAAILSQKEIKKLSELAQSLGLEVLLEVHNQEELDKSLMPSLNMIGVNNRNLKTFEVSLETSRKLAKNIPNEFVKISESGISCVKNVKELQNYGYKGFLMGEHFMKTNNPGETLQTFINQLLP